MMKKILTVTLVFLLVMMSGCHGSVKDTEFIMPESFDESKNYEIVFWAKNDSNKNQVAVYRKAIEDFEKVYPCISVKLSLYTDYGQIYNDVITNIATDTTPNVCITYPDHIATYITGADTVIPLDELMNDERYGMGGSEIRFDAPKKEEIVPEFLKEGIINDRYYALPFMRSTEALYINADFVHELGYEIPDTVTWDWIWEVSDKAVEKNEDGIYYLNGQNVMIPFIYKSTDNMMISMLKQLHADYSDEDGNILIFNDTTKEILEEIAGHVYNGAFSTFKISSYPANFLNAGQCVFAIDSTAGATWMGSDAPLVDIPEDQLVEFETVVRPIPQYDVNEPYMISQGPSICIFQKDDPDEVLASWLFTQYLLSNDVQIAYSETEGYVPVTSKAQESEEYQDYLSEAGSDNDEHYAIKIASAELLMDNTSHTFVTPVFNGSASLRTAAGQLIEETCKGVRRGKTVDDAFFSDLYSDINSLYRLDQAGGVSVGRDLGPLPLAAKLLIGGLATAWVIIAVIYMTTRRHKGA